MEPVDARILSTRPDGQLMLALGFRPSPIRIICPPILGVLHALGPAPIIAIVWSGQPALLAGGFPLLLTANLGTVTLAWVTARIRLEPLFAAETFFSAMLGLHPAFLTMATWHSPWMSVADYTRLSHDPDQAAPPENCPSDFRLARAAGALNFRIPLSLARGVRSILHRTTSLGSFSAIRTRL